MAIKYTPPGVGFLDSRYLRIANNLSDLNNVATARTNLGLVAGGAGDIWVEKAGDTMSGVLTIQNNLIITSNNELRFADNGNYVGFEAPALSANQIWVLPIADGNADDFLQTDGSGTLSWAAGGGGGGPASHFKAVMSSDQNISASTSTLINFDTEDWDIGSDYNTTDKSWTPPAGKIEIHAQIEWSGLSTNDLLGIKISKNGTDVARRFVSISTTNTQGVDVTWQDDANGTDIYTAIAFTSNANIISSPTKQSFWFGRTID